ncbi:MAG TPA: CPBP family intramembrane glutamic endopeptidase [Acidimicrobiia bacterium]
MREVWVWRRWTRWPLTPAILLVAAGVIGLDVVAAWRDWALGHLGPVAMSPALPLGLVLAWMIGWGRLGLDRENLRAWREFLVVMGTVLVVGAWAWVSTLGKISEVFALVLGALDEELVYRLAVLMVIGAGCAALLGRSWRNPENWGLGPGVVAMFGSGLVFALLPGHVAQMHDALGVVPFMSLGVVLAYAVLRTGALFPAVVVHASLNQVTIYAYHAAVPEAWRIAFSACALVALVAGTVVAGLRLGMLEPVPITEWRRQMMRPNT